MHIDEAIRSRRAVKGYDAGFTLSSEEKNELLQLALLAPTAFNLQHVRLVEVSDPALRQQIREVGWGQAQMTDAAMLVVVCAQLDSWEKNVNRVWDGAPVEVQQFMAGAIDKYYRDKPQVQRDETMRSCGLVAQTLMLAARCSWQGPGLLPHGRLRLRCRGQADQPAGKPRDRPDGRRRQEGHRAQATNRQTAL